GPRHRVEVPDAPAVPRVVRADAAAHGVLATREADDDFAVVIERRGRDAFADAGIASTDVPDHLARELIERDEPTVEAAHVNLAVAEPHAAAQAAAADDRVLEIDVRFVGPEDLARVDAHGEHVVVARDDIEHTFVEQRLR